MHQLLYLSTFVGQPVKLNLQVSTMDTIYIVSHMRKLLSKFCSHNVSQCHI